MYVYNISLVKGFVIQLIKINVTKLIRWHYPVWERSWEKKITKVCYKKMMQKYALFVETKISPYWMIKEEIFYFLFFSCMLFIMNLFCIPKGNQK